jgi:type IV pilus assembly protein PilA
MKQRGFTLIEVMIVLAIFSLIVIVAAPLSGSWVREANMTESEGQLTQAVGRAKAAALRNKMGATGNAPASAVCLSNTKLLTVREGTSAGVAPHCTTPTGDQLWQAQVNASITVQANSAALSCMCFTNKGTLTNDGNCATCSTSTTFTISATGVEPKSFALY